MINFNLNPEQLTQLKTRIVPKLKRVLRSDLLWRPIAMLMICLTAWGFLVVLQQQAYRNAVSPLSTGAGELALAVNNWLEGQADRAEDLANDPRLQAAFNSANWRDNVLTVRRTIYEFSYLNKVNDVYAVNPTTAPNLVKTAGAPAIPLGIFKLLMETDQPVTSLMVNVGQQPKLLVMLALRPEPTMPVAGYVAYLADLNQALSTLELPPLSRVGHNFALFRDRGDGKVSALTALGRSTLITLAPGETNLPIFGGSGGVGEFNWLGRSLVAVVAVPRQQGWYTAAYTSVDAIGDNPLRRLAIQLGAAFLCALLLVIPGRGDYARLLVKLRIYNPKDPIINAGLDSSSAVDTALGGALAAAGVDVAATSSDVASNPKVRAAYEATQTTERKKEKTRYASQRKESGGELTDNVILYLIRHAVTNLNIKLLYQPIIDTTDGSIAMYEVFLRLLDDDGTEIPPGKFMPVAEQNNMMSELDEAVIRKVMADFFERGKMPPAPLSINLSGDTFDSLGYMNRIIDAASSGKVPPGQLNFELRSREIIADKRAMDFIREGREMGFSFAMDYFGGGPQVIKAARSLKFSYAKVDGFRFKDLATNRDQQKSLARLALASKEAEIPLIVERVESALLDKLARKLGVRYLQGYRYAQPSNEFVTVEKLAA